MEEVLVEDGPNRTHGKCQEHHKSWWKFNWKGPHEYNATMITVWGFGKYKMWFKCKHCGAKYDDFGITQTEMVEMNLPIHDIYVPQGDTDFISYKRVEFADEAP